MFNATASRQNQVARFVMSGQGTGIALQRLLRQFAQKRRHIAPDFFQSCPGTHGGFEYDRFHLTMVLR